MLTATCLAESLQAALCLQEICVCHSLLLFSFAPLLFTKIYKTFTSGSLLPKKNMVIVCASAFPIQSAAIN